MNEQEIQPKKSFFRRFWWIGLVIILGLGVTWGIMNFVVHPKGSDSGDNRSVVDQLTGKFPKCPANLSGILTYQLMDPKYIGSMLPLGNVAPPGHTSPVDHIYFEDNADGHIPLYAPADGWITAVMADSQKKLKH